MIPRWRPLAIRTRLTLYYSTILLAVLLVISAISYSVLAWTLRQEVDASLLTVAQIIRDTGGATADASGGVEAVLRELLGPEVYDKFFQLIDPEGRPGYRSPHLSTTDLPLSALARDNARHGRPTFETVQVGRRRTVRLLTLPIVRDGRLQHLVQVGIDLHRSQRTLAHYLETLVVLIPLGVVLAAAGGAATARAALGPVDAISRTARRITAEDLERRIPLQGTGDELDRLAATLNEMLARLEGAFSATRRFAADAAHELRTPLTALKGGLEVALRAPRSTAAYRQALASSLEDVERLIRLAEDLLLFSRSSAGFDQPGGRVELEPLVLDVLETGVRLAKGTSVSVRLGELAPLAVVGDGPALRRALMNLVHNAVKYTPAGGSVGLSLVAEGGRAALVVQDTGPGVAASDAERIFQPFVRLDPPRARDTGGAGLGLAIARTVAVAHGGELSLDPSPVGCRFVMRLPLAG